MKIYQPTLSDRLLEAVAMWLYGSWKILRWTVTGLLVVAIPVGLYLGIVAIPWWLYGYVAGYFLPENWAPALRHPEYWHFVGLVTLLGGLRLLWLLPSLPVHFAVHWSNGDYIRFSLGRKKAGRESMNAGQEIETVSGRREPKARQENCCTSMLTRNREEGSGGVG
ncbi:MAG: hypothetical protein PHO57_09460 [Acidithiobacillus sp.]|nr:hypothetical protein [Acidithiobacillus sp.]